ncbi:putative plasmid partitioning protein [Mycobacterium xenopi 4042]|uniref:Putative plasmid partitioning protein n=1 Tax=Mycobacterium xenopi 4042 TaxID=1299334 RepID=X8DA23_MYCXE|nr:putative plasmid partitioning protein [Mycobacterium xenopi 4042]
MAKAAQQSPGIAEVYVDTAGWFDLDPDSCGDGLGDGYSADALRTVLDVTDEAIVPILPAPMCFDPTARTIRKLLEPRNIPYRVFINDWDPETVSTGCWKHRTSFADRDGR